MAEREGRREGEEGAMSFSFFKPSKPKSTPVELARALKECLLGLDTKTVADARAHEKVCARFLG